MKTTKICCFVHTTSAIHSFSSFPLCMCVKRKNEVEPTPPQPDFHSHPTLVYSPYPLHHPHHTHHLHSSPSHPHPFPIIPPPPSPSQTRQPLAFAPLHDRAHALVRRHCKVSLGVWRWCPCIRVEHHRDGRRRLRALGTPGRRGHDAITLQRGQR